MTENKPQPDQQPEPKQLAGLGEHSNKAVPRGLYKRFHVEHADRTPLDPDAITFVMRPDKDPVARAALETYARLTDNEALAQDLYELLSALYFHESQRRGAQ